jgi:hypothetical protein
MPVTNPGTPQQAAPWNIDAILPSRLPDQHLQAANHAPVVGCASKSCKIERSSKDAMSGGLRRLSKFGSRRWWAVCVYIPKRFPPPGANPG